MNMKRGKGEEGEGEEGEESDADGEGGSSEQHACSQVPAIPPYTLQAGCTATIEGNRPLSYMYLSKLVDTPLLQHVVEQTNFYAEQCIADPTIKQHSRVRKWGRKQHTINELRQFQAIVTAMGILRYPSLQDYWSSS